MCVGRSHTLPAEPCLAESASPHTPTFLFPSPSKTLGPLLHIIFACQLIFLVNSEQRICDKGKGRGPGRAGQGEGGGRELLGEKAGCGREVLGISRWTDGLGCKSVILRLGCRGGRSTLDFPPFG